MLNVTSFWYLDNDGILSIYTQFQEKLETESIETLKRDKGKKISAKIGLGKALGVFLGLIEIDGSGELNSSATTETQIHYKTAPENHLRFILQTLSKLGEPHFFNDLKAGAKHCHENREATFLMFQEQFDAPQFYLGRSGIDIVNNEGAFLFTKDMDPFDNYIYRDDYFKYEAIPVTMAASAHKFVHSRNGHFGQTSHEALRFGSQFGKNINLTVFGTIFPVGEHFQLKPYAIW
ncbi:MAG: hypothetical protein HYV28_10395 [Ignavibacteriales bacterium]|nr:hypothetical protein [Ignavibacteriales bacterium]